MRNATDTYAVPILFVGLALLVLIPPAYKPRVVGFKAMLVIVHR